MIGLGYSSPCCSILIVLWDHSGRVTTKRRREEQHANGRRRSSKSVAEPRGTGRHDLDDGGLFGRRFESGRGGMEDARDVEKYAYPLTAGDGKWNRTWPMRSTWSPASREEVSPRLRWCWAAVDLAPPFQKAVCGTRHPRRPSRRISSPAKASSPHFPEDTPGLISRRSFMTRKYMTKTFAYSICLARPDPGNPFYRFVSLGRRFIVYAGYLCPFHF